jgi:hypothetical protein
VCRLHNRPKKSRVLGLAIGPGRLGFAVLEESAQLLDWGVRNYRGSIRERRARAKRIFSGFLRSFRPTAVAIRGRKNPAIGLRKTATSILRAIKTEAERQSGGLRVLSVRDMRRFYSACGCKTKHEMAELIARRFEELSWRLPRARKPWQPEPSIYIVFDAVASGMAFHHRGSPASKRNHVC